MEKTTTIRIDISQKDRAKKIKEKYNKNIKDIFEDGLLVNENKEDYSYYLLLQQQKEIENNLIGHKAKVEHERRESRIVATTFQETLCDILKIWENSNKNLNDFCTDGEELQYLAKCLGKYKEFGTMEDLKRLLKEKKNFYKQTTFKK